MFCVPIQAQDMMSLEKAIELALEHNYQIKIQQYDVEISALQVDPALVGRKPVINLNASYEFGWSDAELETLPLGPPGESNDPLELDGIANTVIVSPELNLLLLDGGASKFRLQQLGKLNTLADLSLRQTIEQNVSAVSSAYLQMAQQQSLLDISRQNIELSQERLTRAGQDAEYGTSGTLQQLQIEVDLKTDSVAYRNQTLAYENARRDLNFLIGATPDSAYRVASDVRINTNLDLDELENSFRDKNTLLQLSDQNIELANLDLELAKAAYRPSLQGYANVNFSYLQNDASFLQSTRTIGPAVGVRFQLPISDGGARRIQKQTARLTQQQRLLEKNSLEEELRKDLRNSYAVYLNSLQQLRIEQSNLKSFEQNLENLENMYRLGTATNTDVRSAQLNLNAAQNRLNNYQYTIKQAEIALYLLSGQLIQN